MKTCLVVNLMRWPAMLQCWCLRQMKYHVGILLGRLNSVVIISVANLGEGPKERKIDRATKTTPPPPPPAPSSATINNDFMYLVNRFYRH